MALVFGYFLEFSQKLLQIVHCGVGHSILEIEMGSDGSGHTDLILFLILVNHFPEGVGTKLLLEADGHNLSLLDLDPLDPIYVTCALL